MKRRRLGRRRHMRALAIQAGIVLVCAGVLYAAFLRPDGDDELSGITAEGPAVNQGAERPGGDGPRGEGSQAKPGDSNAKRPQEKRAKERGKRARDGDLRGIRRSPPTLARGNLPAAPAAAAPEPPALPADQGPPASQYSDTVTAIRARLAQAGG